MEEAPPEGALLPEGLLELLRERRPDVADVALDLVHVAVHRLVAGVRHLGVAVGAGVVDHLDHRVDLALRRDQQRPRGIARRVADEGRRRPRSRSRRRPPGSARPLDRRGVVAGSLDPGGQRATPSPARCGSSPRCRARRRGPRGPRRARGRRRSRGCRARRSPRRRAAPPRGRPRPASGGPSAGRPPRQLDQGADAVAGGALAHVGAAEPPGRARDVHVHPGPLVHELAQELGRVDRRRLARLRGVREVGELALGQLEVLGVEWQAPAELAGGRRRRPRPRRTSRRRWRTARRRSSRAR